MSATAPGATTPQLLKQAIYAISGCAVLLLLAVISGARAHRDALQTIGRDTAPGIIAAQHVAAAMADMDASAVNELLLAKDEQVAAHNAFDSRRKEAAEVLIAAAENIKQEGEREPIRTLALGLSSYAEQIQRARDLHHANDPGFLEAYRAAAQTMDETLLPAARDLDHSKREVFDRAYAGQSKWSSGAMVFLVLTAMATVGALIAAQLFLTRRMRRIINPFLMLATGLAVLSFFYFAESFTNADHALKVAKEDAFESVHLLWKTRAVGYSANAEESRYLLDPSRAPQYEQAFHNKFGIASTSLAGELNNITFPGEREAAEKAVAAFTVYNQLDLQIRALEHSGQHAAAIRLCVGDSDVAFAKFDQAIEETLQINQTEFDQAVKHGFDAVNNLEVTSAIVCAGIALLAFFGLFPRLREYSSV